VRHCEHGASAKGAIGRYQLEAAVQSAHVVRRRAGTADWQAIERLYDALLALTSYVLHRMATFR
jgi:RNA polymerase sigma-70 factor (ECF subfamily)